MDAHMPRYSNECKTAVLNKLLPPLNRTVVSVSAEEGISDVTLYSWLKQCRQQGMPVPGNRNSGDDWSGFYSQKHFPYHPRRIRFKDPETRKTLIFLTKLFGPPPTTICELYKARSQVELFPKWIKQHLRIKKFYDTSENAVKVQIWTAVSVYVLIAIIKKRLDLQPSLYTLLQVFSVTCSRKLL